MMRYRPFLFVSLFIAVLTNLSAGGFRSEQDAPLIECNFRIVIAEENAADDFWFEQQDGWRKITLRGMQISDRVRYKGPSLLRLFRNPPVGEDGLPSDLAAEIELPAGGGDCLIIFVRNAGSSRYWSRLIPDGGKSFPGQSVLFVNLTGSMLAGRFGERIVPLNGGEHVVVGYNNEMGETSLHIRMAVQQPDNGEWKVVYSNVVPARGKERRWLMLCAPGEPPLLYPDRVTR